MKKRLKSDEALVSVIIPTYKRAKYLTRAVDSVLRQSYQNIEIIVVDDNDDDSRYREQNIKVMEGYKNYKNIKYLKHKMNKNGAAARNTGVRVAEGEYLTFLDDDDFFLEDRIEKMVRALKDNGGYDCAYSSVAYIKDGKIIAIKNAEAKGNLMLRVLSQDSFFGTGSNLFFRRNAIQTTGLFDEGFVRHQDMEYMVRFFKYGKIVNVNDVLVVKCMDDASNLPNFEKMLDVKKMFLSKFDDEIQKFSEYETKQILFCNYFDAMLTAEYGSQEYKSIKKYLLEMDGVSNKLRRKVWIYDLKHRNKFMIMIAKILGNLKAFLAVFRLGEGKRYEVKSYYSEYKEEK